MSPSDAANNAPSSFEIPPSRFFPPVEAAESDGLLGIAFDGALHPDLIVDALVHGIFPWPFTVPENVGGPAFEDNGDFDDEEDDEFEEFDDADDWDEDDDYEDFDDEDADDFAVFDEKADAADALFDALSPRCRDAVWEGFDASSLLRLGELRVAPPQPNQPNQPN
ncbi:MAG: hypothetical protein IKW13_07860, partial [Thermoguttaceae bacterium]|nr:hypothetical protein [Thermoguttaceae bacterium]